MGHKGAFGGPENVIYIDYGGGYTALCSYQNPSKGTHGMMGFIVCIP